MTAHVGHSKPKTRRRVGMLIRVAKRAPLKGDIVEVGVYKGHSARILYAYAQKHERRLFLYDTFEGHPYPFKRRKKPFNGIGHHIPSPLNMEKLYAGCPDAIITKGEFPGSAIPMQLIAFAHIDVDSYKSTRNTIEYLRPLMKKGGIMYFDDWHKHEETKRAVLDIFPHKDIHIISTIKRAFTVAGGNPKALARRWGIP